MFTLLRGAVCLFICQLSPSFLSSFDTFIKDFFLHLVAGHVVHGRMLKNHNWIQLHFVSSSFPVLSYEPTSCVTTLFLATTAHRLWNRSCTLPSRLDCRALVGGDILADVPSFGVLSIVTFNVGILAIPLQCNTSPEAVETLPGWPRFSGSLWQGLLRVTRHFDCRYVDQSYILQLCGLPSRGLTAVSFTIQGLNSCVVYHPGA